MMTESEAKQLVTNALGAEFNRDNFARLLAEMLKTANAEKAFKPLSGQMIQAPYRGIVSQYERIGQYKDPNGKIIDLLVVKLQKAGSMIRARSALRGFIAHYLKDLRGGQEKDAALVAFHFPNETAWRFSFVRMRYDLVSKGEKIAAERQFTPAHRHSFLVGKQEKTHTAQRQLAGLLQDQAPPTLERLEKAFSVEPVTKRFFQEYRNLYKRVHAAVESALKENRDAGADFAEKGINPVDFAKKLLGQIVFLYFLQRKGWMGVPPKQEWGSGDSEFLRSQFNNREKGATFYAKILQPLFYSALNLDREPDDLYEPLNCRIPFLNGGLFTPLKNHNWQRRGISLPDELFSNQNKTPDGDGNGVLDILDRYNFTIAEDEPAEREVAVDPEMLGKIFENLIEVNERHDQGAFYTPRDIVHFMCQESLRLRLTDALEQSGKLPPDGELDKFIQLADMTADSEIGQLRHGNTSPFAHYLPDSIRNIAAELDSILKKIRVCDPAVGSGAFMVGMMHEIVRLRAALAPAFAKNIADIPNAYQLKYETIAECLYGADKDSGAVEIAQLRLWLSLVVDEENPREIRPLPNLNYKLMTGDTLDRVDRDVLNNPGFETLGNLMAQFFAEAGPSAKKELGKKIDKLLQKLLPPGREFDLQTVFSVPFRENGGFDIVIGNPPYVRQENIPADEKDRLLKAYKRGAIRKSDLFVYFYLRGLDILRKGGVHSFICSNGWLYAEYGVKMEEELLHTAKIAGIYNNESERYFSTAAINTIISVIRNQAPDDESETRFVVFRDTLDKALSDPDLRREIIRTNAQLKEEGTRGNIYVGGKWGGQFLRAPDIYHTVLKKAKDKLVRMSEIATLDYGLKTGANGFFHLNAECIAEWGVEDHFLRPLIKHTRECEKIAVDQTALHHRLFVCNETRKALKGTNALRYIEMGEEKEIHKVRSVASRRLWYSVREQGTFDCLLLIFRHKRMWTPIVESSDIIASNTFFGARYRDRRVVYQANCYANSTLFAFFTEILARVNFGDGVAVTYGPELKDIPFPNVETLREIGADELSAFESLKARPVSSILKEMKMKDRQELDNVFFAALGLTQGERDAVYEGMEKLVCDRINRAGNHPGGGGQGGD